MAKTVGEEPAAVIQEVVHEVTEVVQGPPVELMVRRSECADKQHVCRCHPHQFTLHQFHHKVLMDLLAPYHLFPLCSHHQQAECQHITADEMLDLQIKLR